MVLENGEVRGADAVDPAGSNDAAGPREADLFDDRGVVPVVNLPPRPATPTPSSPPSLRVVIPAFPLSLSSFPSPRTSPYRRRATPLSWTGLEESEWGQKSFIDCETGLLAVISEREAQDGVCAGALWRYDSWYGWEDREDAPLPALGPEIKITSDEGKEYWLGDTQEYYYEYSFEEGAFGHHCDEQCEWWYGQVWCGADDDEEDGGECGGSETSEEVG